MGAAIGFQPLPYPTNIQGKERSEYDRAGQNRDPQYPAVRSGAGNWWHISNHWPYKAVPPFWNGLNVKRTFGIIAKRTSNLPYGEVEASFIIDKSLGAPNLLNNLVAGDGFSPIAHQQSENFGWLWLELDRGSICAQFTTSEIQLELREANHNFLPGNDGHSPPRGRTGTTYSGLL